MNATSWGTDSLHVNAGFPDINGVEVGTRSSRIQGIDARAIEKAIVAAQTPGEPVKLRSAAHRRQNIRHLVPHGRQGPNRQ